MFTPTQLPAEYFALGSSPDSCHVLKSPDNFLAFCEDATFWDILGKDGKVVDRKVIASCDPNRKSWNTVMGPLKDPNPRGTLWIVEFDDKKEVVHELKLENYPKGKDLHPLGVQIWPSKSGSASNMFVVNHGRFNTTVEQFTVEPSNPTAAKFVQTITSPYFVSPNALALTSPTSFFVTNDHLLTRRLPSFLGKSLPLFETFSGLPLGFVSHVSIVNESSPGTAVIKHSVTKPGISVPNGVALSPDGRTLAVASSSWACVHFFNRTQGADGSEVLTRTHHVPVPFAPDNIHYDDNGELTVAGHPYFPGLVAVAENKTDVLAPSWVVSVTPREGDESKGEDFDKHAPLSAAQRVNAVPSHKIETIYQGDGTKFAGSTTGLKDTRTGAFFVTGLYQEGLLVCRP